MSVLQWFWVWLLLQSIVHGQTVVCNTQTGPCTCETNQGLLDLTPLDQGTPPRFSDVPSSVGGTFAYSPCQMFTISSCFDVAVCQNYHNSGSYYDMGSFSSAAFGNDGDDLQLQYTARDGYYKSFVTLKCDPEQEGSFTADRSEHVQYYFTLTSKYACPGGGGGGGGTPYTQEVVEITPYGRGGGNNLLCMALCVMLFILIIGYLVGKVVYKCCTCNGCNQNTKGAEAKANIVNWESFQA